jgi:hypothetical protein
MPDLNPHGGVPTVDVGRFKAQNTDVLDFILTAGFNRHSLVACYEYPLWWSS